APFIAELVHLNYCSDLLGAVGHASVDLIIRIESWLHVSRKTKSPRLLVPLFGRPVRVDHSLLDEHTNGIHIRRLPRGLLPVLYGTRQAIPELRQLVGLLLGIRESCLGKLQRLAGRTSLPLT